MTATALTRFLLFFIFFVQMSIPRADAADLKTSAKVFRLDYKGQTSYLFGADPDLGTALLETQSPLNFARAHSRILIYESSPWSTLALQNAAGRAEGNALKKLNPGARRIYENVFRDALIESAGPDVEHLNAGASAFLLRLLLPALNHERRQRAVEEIKSLIAKDGDQVFHFLPFELLPAAEWVLGYAIDEEGLMDQLEKSRAPVSDRMATSPFEVALQARAKLERWDMVDLTSRVPAAAPIESYFRKVNQAELNQYIMKIGQRLKRSNIETTYFTRARELLIEERNKKYFAFPNQAYVETENALFDSEFSEPRIFAVEREIMKRTRLWIPLLLEKLATGNALIVIPLIRAIGDTRFPDLPGVLKHLADAGVVITPETACRHDLIP